MKYLAFSILVLAMLYMAYHLIMHGEYVIGILVIVMVGCMEVDDATP